MRRFIICLAFLVLVLGTLWGCSSEGGLNDFTLPPKGPTTTPPCEVHTLDEGVQTIFCGFCNYTEYTCTVCGYTEIREGEVPAAHDYTTDYAAPACGEKGLTTYTCLICANSFEVEDAAPKAHVMDNGVHTDGATCADKGYTTFSCADCDHTDVVEDEQVRGHDLDGGTYTAATACGAFGYTTFACSRCDYDEVVQDSNPLPHNYTNPTYTAATVCGQKAIISYTCDICNESIEEPIGDPLDHDLDAGTYTAATTCGEKGYTTYACQRGECDHTEVVEDAQALAHSYSGTEIAGNCAQDKGTQYTCSTCGDSYFEADAQWVKPDHDWNLTGSTEADCQHYASSNYECTVCFATKSEEGTEYGDHKYESGYTVDVQPTVDSTGLKSHHCTVEGCDAKTGEVVIPKTEVNPDLPFIPAGGGNE